MQELILTTSTRATPSVKLNHLSDAQRELLPMALSEFLDVAATATGRATFYNAQDEQVSAAEAAHRELFAMDRGIYAAALLLRGVTDFNCQIGAARLLAGGVANPGLLTREQEYQAIAAMFGRLPPQRLLKLFVALRRNRVNNARTRRLVLSSILNASKLEFWAVKYRRKLATALIHVWGRRTASILRSTLATAAENRTAKERQIVRRCLAAHVTAKPAELPVRMERVEQCVRFVLGDEQNLTLPRLAAYHAAKEDFARGTLLPYETMEGLRSRYHADKSSADVLKLTRRQLTAGQQMVLQRKAESEEVEVAFDPARYDAVRLYLYALERGMDGSIRDALLQKAAEAAGQLPLQFGHAAILIDASASMQGNESQLRRPIATALAVRDLLVELSERATTLASNGVVSEAGELLHVEGDTSLAAGLVTLLRQQPDIVFVLSDGYENAPAGRFAEAMRAVRSMGIQTPVHQLSPVLAAESRGIRVLSSDVSGLPVSRPDALGLGLLKALFEADLERGVAALLGFVGPALTRNDGAVRIEEVKDDS